MTGSFREYAKHRGCSPEAVSQAVADGRIADAEIGRADGGAVPGNGRARILDFEKADELWELNTAPRPDADEALLEAKRRTAVAEADLKEHKRDVELGLYWRKEDVLKRARAHAAMITAAREALPMQLAPQLVGKTDLAEIETILRTAIRECDTRVSNEIRSRFGGDDEQPAAE